MMVKKWTRATAAALAACAVLSSTPAASFAATTKSAATKTTAKAAAKKTTVKAKATVKAKKPTAAECEKKIAAALKKAKYSRIEVAAMMGNWKRESNLDPWMVEKKYSDAKYLQSYADSIVSGKLSRASFLAKTVPSRGSKRPLGYGICQWTSPARKGALWDFAASRKSNVADLDTQVAFAIYEMKAFGFGPGWAKKLKSVDAATKTYMRKYEGIDDGTSGLRIADAKKFYVKYK